MIALVITGGQTGADQSGWRAAKAAGIACGGWMVEDFWTEAGRRPDFAAEYGAKLLPGVDHLSVVRTMLRRRAEANVRDADVTICFDLAGSRATGNAEFDCRKHGKRFRLVRLCRDPDGRIERDWRSPEPDEIASWLGAVECKSVNISGNRESKVPGIGVWVESYLTEVFRLLKATGEPTVPGRPSVPSPSASPAAPPHPEDR
jgi:hypothetical protein